MTDDELADALLEAEGPARALVSAAARRIKELARELDAVRSGEPRGAAVPKSHSGPVAFPAGSWLTVDEAAAYCRTTVPAMHQRVRAQTLRPDGRGHKNALLFKVESLDAHMASCERRENLSKAEAKATTFHRPAPTAPTASQQGLRRGARAILDAFYAKERGAAQEARESRTEPLPRAQRRSRRESRDSVREWLQKRRNGVQV